LRAKANKLASLMSPSVSPLLLAAAVAFENLQD
jgi:hypothetical protein